MTKQKRRRGRPIGGKHPEALREYWRIQQQIHRTIVGGKKPEQKRRRKR